MGNQPKFLHIPHIDILIVTNIELFDAYSISRAGEIPRKLQHVIRQVYTTELLLSEGMYNERKQTIHTHNPQLVKKATTEITFNTLTPIPESATYTIS
jgi:hypothetical protein